MTAQRAAVFLDRDGTIIVDRDYPGDPSRVELIPGAAHAIVSLRKSGLAAVMITNQSGIARGLISEDDYKAVQGRMEDLLAAEGARLDAAYYCPHGPDTTPPCECRKPRVGLYLQAAAEQGLDLAASYFVGDRMRDVLPGVSFGGTGFLVRGTEEVWDDELPGDVHRVESLAQAAELILARRV